MKLDPTVMRTMDRKDYRVLEAVEEGMKNHGIVPGPIVASLANLRHGGSHKIISSLLRDKLLSHECKTKKGGYDGYRLTNAGYDILALHNLKQRGFVVAFGDRIGTGKESDVYLSCNKDGTQHVLKFHRLGRTSFRNVKQKRDYFNNTSKQHQPNSWLFLSRLSAIKEFAFMKALHSVNYPTPTPIAHNRHVVVMSLVRGVPLYQLQTNQVSAAQAQSIFQDATNMAVRLAQQHGLVHCDLNEFNLLVDMSGGIQPNNSEDVYVRHSGMSVAPSKGALSGMGPWDERYDPAAMAAMYGEQLQPEELEPPKPIATLEETGEPKPIVTLIDFPQMVSTQHPNAKELYERDLHCLVKFFAQKLQCQIPKEDLTQHLLEWDTIIEEQEEDDNGNTTSSPSLDQKVTVRLDVELKASGYSVEDSKRELELFYFQSNEQLMHSIMVEEQDSEEDDEEDNDSNDNDDNQQDSNEQAAEEEEDNAPTLVVVQDDPTNTTNVKSNIHTQNTTTITKHNDPARDDDDDDDDVPEVENLLDGLTITNNPLREEERRQMEEKAKQRVRKQLEEQKKKGKKKGAFRATRNQNKRYVKGKRVMDDFGI
ncbi:protein kinase RIO2 [Seminavis robusta]|uniref:non-specific serine/threonine protein kinase n=1 Tax=Seminavis robusta TaxID=568900 RepID=A0A9N8E679_9STRA|nr:protein kinase RIO2 [Seminavis robusta]|eukprot:Sro586_g171140.1 protein kinase RIO2 (594) ;mRNA; f:19617-21398